MTLARLKILSLSDLIMSRCCERANKFNWGSKSTIRIYKVPLVKVVIKSHVFLVVRIQ